MSFSADHVLERLAALAAGVSGYWVAYSGGLDSHVLLHCLATQRKRLPAPLRAVHVNHSLQAEAPVWAQHCQSVCTALQVPLEGFVVDARPAPGESPEAAARQARYRVLAEWLPAGQALLTAHHQDDQAETLLLQLLRGAGPKGLAAMPPSMSLGQGYLLRPLLDVPRSALLDYAERHALQWIEDPSNAQQGYDRNYLRHSILPLLRERWPACARVLARSAAHQAEATQLLDELAESDRAASQGSGTALQVSALRALTASRRANLLRHWLQTQGADLPSSAVLARIDADVLNAAADAEPQVQWGAVMLRRYRDRLYLLPARGEPDPDVGLRQRWDAREPIAFAGGMLTPLPVIGAGVAARHLQACLLELRLRQGGERLQPAGRREHHSLKHLFQDAGVPPWERPRVPLIYSDDVLIAVAGYWVCEGFQAAPEEPGVQFQWSRAIVPDGSFW